MQPAADGQKKQVGKLKTQPVPVVLFLAATGGLGGTDLGVGVALGPILVCFGLKRWIADKCQGFDPVEKSCATVGHVTFDRYLADVC